MVLGHNRRGFESLPCSALDGEAGVEPAWVEYHTLSPLLRSTLLPLSGGAGSAAPCHVASVTLDVPGNGPGSGLYY